VVDQIEHLCDVLGEEARVCGDLAGVLRDEQDAVVHLRPEAILTCLERRETLQEHLVRLARQRRALVEAVAAAHGRATSRATEVLPLLPPEPQTRVRGQLRELRRALLEARGLGRQNALLLGSSLENVVDLLRTLRALVPGARYGADAQVATPSGSDRLDRRA
jgi:flagellar biosynthesis/type III secretory pathway chaperone